MSTDKELVFSFLTSENAKQFFFEVISISNNLVVGHPISDDTPDIKRVSISGEGINDADVVSEINSLYEKLCLTSHVNDLLQRAERFDQANQTDEAQKLREEARQLASQYASISMEREDTSP